VLSKLLFLAFLVLVGAAWFYGGKAKANLASEVSHTGNTLGNRRGARGLLWTDFGKRDDFSEAGWRYRNRAILCSTLALGALPRLGIDRAREVLEELQTDPQLGKEARIQLRRLDRARSGTCQWF
jgi:hypothetical protein